jgi:hypothetical protein
LKKTKERRRRRRKKKKKQAGRKNDEKADVHFFPGAKKRHVPFSRGFICELYRWMKV